MGAPGNRRHSLRIEIRPKHASSFRFETSEGLVAISALVFGNEGILRPNCVDMKAPPIPECQGTNADPSLQPGRRRLGGTCVSQWRFVTRAGGASGYLPRLDSAMLRKTRVMVSAPPSARWMSRMEMSWLAGSIQPWVPKAPPWP